MTKNQSKNSFFLPSRKVILGVATASLSLLLVACGGGIKGDLGKGEHEIVSMFEKHGIKPSQAPYWMGVNEYKGGKSDVKVDWKTMMDTSNKEGMGKATTTMSGETKEWKFFSFNGEQAIFDSDDLVQQLILVRTSDPMMIDIQVIGTGGLDPVLVWEAKGATAVGAAVKREIPTVYPSFIKESYKDMDGATYQFDKSDLVTPMGRMTYRGTNRSADGHGVELYFGDVKGTAFASVTYNQEKKSVELGMHQYEGDSWSKINETELE